jgi:isocitrate dehydrogenase kinase/phosphatase
MSTIEVRKMARSNDGAPPSIDFDVRDAEIDTAAADPATAPALRAELGAHKRSFAAFAFWVDARLPSARVGWFAEIMRRTEPLEVRAVLALRRHRAGTASEREVIAAFRDLRRCFMQTMSAEVGT